MVTLGSRVETKSGFGSESKRMQLLLVALTKDPLGSKPGQGVKCCSTLSPRGTKEGFQQTASTEQTANMLMLIVN